MDNKLKIKGNSIILINRICDYLYSHNLNFILICIALLFYNISHYECNEDLTLSECRAEFWKVSRLLKIISFMVISNICLFTIVYWIINKKDAAF